jgi:hypothetical protein
LPVTDAAEAVDRQRDKPESAECPHDSGNSIHFRERHQTTHLRECSAFSICATLPSTLSCSGQVASRSRSIEFQELVVSGTVPLKERFPARVFWPRCLDID